MPTITFDTLPAEVFRRLKGVVETRGVKLLLLTGESGGKTQFVQNCLNGQDIDVVKLGVVLSSRIVGIAAGSVGCETRDFLSDLHEDGPVAIDDVEMLFDVGMDINVLSVLKYAARTRLLVVNWPGPLDADEGVIYFARGDVQQKSYSLDSEVVVFDDSGVVYPETI